MQTLQFPSAAARSPQTIVIGMGIDIRGDDGFGAAVLEALRRQPDLAARAQLARCDGEPAQMIDLWQDYRCALVIDAVRGGPERYGFVYRRQLTPGPTTRPSGPGSRSGAGNAPGGNIHAASLGAAIRLGQVLDRLPEQLVLYAVHGRDFRLGAPLSGPVAAAVPHLASRISRELLGVLSLGRRDEGPAAPQPHDRERVLSSHATPAT